MRMRSFAWILALLAGLAGASGGSPALASQPLETTFEYQGVLRDGAENVEGLFDFQLHLYDDADPGLGTWLGSVEALDVVVSGGLFSLTLDFDPALFQGEERWLEIHVRPGSETGEYDPLLPRQRIAPTPYALFALTGNEGPQGPQGEPGPRGEKGDPGDPAPAGVDLVSDQLIDGFKTFAKDVVVVRDIYAEDDLFVEGLARVISRLQVGEPSETGEINIYSGSGEAINFYRVGGLRYGEIGTNVDNDLIMGSPVGITRITDNLYLRYTNTSSWRDLWAGDVNIQDDVIVRDGSSAIGRYGRRDDDLYINVDSPGRVWVHDELFVSGDNGVYMAFGTSARDVVRWVEGPDDDEDLDLHLGQGDDGWLQVFGNLRVKGSVAIENNLSKFSGSFKIDHPLDPENQYLVHSFVESPDMLNLYDGVVTTDKEGEAWVELPSYFEALNIDYRYQLTVIGQFAQAIIGEEVRNNRFLIRTDRPDVQVSWQVTGVRNDDWARENRLVPEVDKPDAERGTRLYEPRQVP